MSGGRVIELLQLPHFFPFRLSSDHARLYNGKLLPQPSTTTSAHRCSALRPRLGPVGHPESLDVIRVLLVDLLLSSGFEDLHSPLQGLFPPPLYPPIERCSPLSALLHPLHPPPSVRGTPSIPPSIILIISVIFGHRRHVVRRGLLGCRPPAVSPPRRLHPHRRTHSHGG